MLRHRRPASFWRLKPAALLLATLLSFGLLACDTEDSPVYPKVELSVNGVKREVYTKISLPILSAGASPLHVDFEVKNKGPGDLHFNTLPPVQITGDNALILTTTQPSSRAYKPGESFRFTITITPHTAGQIKAQAKVDLRTAHPITIDFTGEISESHAPGGLSLSLNGTAVEDTIHFGVTPVAGSSQHTLLLTNTGGSPIALNRNTLKLSNQNHEVFSLTFDPPAQLGPAQSVEATLHFNPGVCGNYQATLRIEQGSGPVTVLGRSGDNPQEHLNALRQNLPAQPSFLPVAISDATSSGRRQIAIGNSSAHNHVGETLLYPWTGCTISSDSGGFDLTPSDISSSDNFFGHRIALSRHGDTLLVTTRGSGPSAWLFGLADTPESTGLTATLSVDHDNASTSGFGTGAALSADGRTALINENLAHSDSNAHGAVHVFSSDSGPLTDRTASDWRLGPLTTTNVRDVGRDIAINRDASIVVASAILGVHGGGEAPAAAYIWLKKQDDGVPTWGQYISDRSRHERSEDLLLVTNATPSDDRARVAISADGNTIALGFRINDTAYIHLFERSPGTDDPWGRNESSTGHRLASAKLDLPIAGDFDLKLASDGAFLLVSDPDEIREIARPTLGWTNASLDTYQQRWALSIVSEIALSPDDSTIAVLDETKSLWTITR